MYAKLDIPKESQYNSVRRHVSQYKREKTHGTVFIDNRPNTAVQQNRLDVSYSRTKDRRTSSLHAPSLQVKERVAQRANGSGNASSNTNQSNTLQGPARHILPIAGLWMATNRALISQSFTPYMYYAMGQAHEAGAWFTMGRNARLLALRNPLAFGPLALGLFGMTMRYRQ